MANEHNDSAGDSPTPGKGRLNAILTYERVSEIEQGIVEIRAMLAPVVEQVNNHGDRLRHLELTQATMLATQAARASGADRARSNTVWVWGMIFAAINTAVAVASLYFLATNPARHHPQVATEYHQQQQQQESTP